MSALLDRYRGCLVGLAVGDAIGTTVEFSPRDSFVPVTDMVGGGPFELEPGRWTDDTSMALCLAHSLLARDGFDARDQMNRYLDWRSDGYMSSTGRCFDIGLTVSTALTEFTRTDDPYAGSTDPNTAGNGSLMRLAPVPMFFHPSVADVLRFSRQSSRTTHGAPEVLDCCELMGHVLQRCLDGSPKQEVLDATGLPLAEAKVIALAHGRYTAKSREHIRGSGYAVASLEAALWCFERTSDFASAVLEAVNLGDDADTTAAITGQIAGAFYGFEAIPLRWRRRLYWREEIQRLAESLYGKSMTRQRE